MSKRPYPPRRRLSYCPFKAWVCGTRSSTVCSTAFVPACQCAPERLQPTINPSSSISSPPSMYTTLRLIVLACALPAGRRLTMESVFEEPRAVDPTQPWACASPPPRCRKNNIAALQNHACLSLECLYPGSGGKIPAIAFRRRISRCFYPRNLVLKTGLFGLQCYS